MFSRQDLRPRVRAVSAVMAKRLGTAECIRR